MRMSYTFSLQMKELGEDCHHTTLRASSGMYEPRHSQCNPSLMLWQAYLKFSKIDFRIASANNHASPSGALPFLIPASADPYKHIPPIPSGKLQKWGMNNSKMPIEEPGDMRYEAYLALLDHRIRRAWVCRLAYTCCKQY